jgi:hypothetical protein
MIVYVCMCVCVGIDRVPTPLSHVSPLALSKHAYTHPSIRIGSPMHSKQAQVKHESFRV